MGGAGSDSSSASSSQQLGTRAPTPRALNQPRTARWMVSAALSTAWGGAAAAAPSTRGKGGQSP
eukprot:12617175-Alexandrium_andersonii.AAC.1